LFFKGIFALSVAGVLALTASDTFQELPPTHQNVEVLARLDEVTRAAGSPENTIPAFLALSGRLAAIERAAAPTQPVKTIDEADLRRGFCSSSLARLVRHEHPGFYDEWPDEKIERAITERLPESRHRLCAISYEVEALPADIVKYRLRARSIPEWTGLVAWTLIVPTIFAALCLLVYYRFVAGLLASVANRASKPSIARPR
jgi:hypothetical protein